MKETKGTHVALAASRLISSKGKSAARLGSEGSCGGACQVACILIGTHIQVEAYIQSYMRVYVCFVLRISEFIKIERYRYK